MRMYCLYCCIKIPGGSWAKSSTVSENPTGLTADTETGGLGSGILQVYCNISSIAYKTVRFPSLPRTWLIHTDLYDYL